MKKLQRKFRDENSVCILWYAKQQYDHQRVTLEFQRFKEMKKGRRPNDLKSLMRQPLFLFLKFLLHDGWFSV